MLNLNLAYIKIKKIVKMIYIYIKINKLLKS